MDMAAPRTFVGKIYEMITQQTASFPIAWPATNSMIPMRMPIQGPINVCDAALSTVTANGFADVAIRHFRERAYAAFQLIRLRVFWPHRRQ